MGMSLMEGNEAIAWGALGRRLQIFRRLPHHPRHQRVQQHA